MITMMYKGKERTIASISKLSGKTKQDLYYLINKYTAKEIENILDGKIGKYEYEGKRYTLQELSLISKVKSSTINTRIHNGWSIKDAIEIPVYKGGKSSKSWRKNYGIQ